MPTDKAKNESPRPSLKVKLGALSAMRPALARLADQKYPVKTAYWLSRRLRVIDAELGTYEEKRAALVREYGTEREGRIEVLPSAPKFAEFVQKFNELGGIEVSLDIDLISVDDLQAPDVLVSPSDLQLLAPLLAE